MLRAFTTQDFGTAFFGGEPGVGAPEEQVGTSWERLKLTTLSFSYFATLRLRCMRVWHTLTGVRGLTLFYFASTYTRIRGVEALKFTHHINAL
jgi:hypothetical protein